MPPGGAGFDIAPVDILVVDDRPENVLALKAVLSNPDYNVVTAANGSEALRKVLKHDFAVVLLDVLMPAMDGFETARMIFERDASRGVPIIFLTAAGADLGSMREGYAVGAVDYLVKPIEPEIVRAKVAVFVDLFRKTRQIQRQEVALREAERLQSQRVLSEREAEYETTFEEAAVGIAHVGLDRRCLRVNQKFCEIVGYGREEALQLRLETIAHAEDIARQAEGLQLLTTGSLKSFRSEERFIHRSGRVLRIDLTVSLLRDTSGAPLKFIAIVEDATLRKRAEEGQRVLAQVSRLLLDSLASGPALEAVAQCVVPVLADWCVIELAAPEPGADSSLFVAHLEPARAGELAAVFRRHQAVRGPSGSAVSQPAQLLRELTPTQLARWAADPKDAQVLQQLGLESGIIVPLAGRGKPLGSITLFSSGSGRVYQPADLATAEDLAQRVSFAVENARLFRDAQEAIAVRDEFLSIASHELRTPLTPLQLQLERMLGIRGMPGIEEMPREQVRGIVQRSAVQVARLTALIDSLLDVSRITSGRLALQPEQVDLALLAREVTGRFADEASNAGSPITLVAPAPVLGRCDPLRVEQVLANLLTNAIKYGASNPIVVRLSVEGERAILSVTDRGIGIAAEQVAVIFDRFERGAAGRNYAGLGLGLYIARQIVEAHSGSIRVESKPGAGSAFIVELPLESASTEVPTDGAKTPEPAAAPARDTRHGRTVLVVEDDEDILTCVAELLRAEGYQVVVAANGQEGLDRLEALRLPPDAIVLDLMMPVLDGFGFSLEQQKRPEWSAIPVLVVSGDGNGPTRHTAIPRAQFLRKPVEAHDLLRRLDQLCQR